VADVCGGPESNPSTSGTAKDTLTEASRDLGRIAGDLDRLLTGGEVPERLAAEALLAVDKMRAKLAKLDKAAEDAAGDLSCTLAKLRLGSFFIRHNARLLGGGLRVGRLVCPERRSPRALGRTCCWGLLRYGAWLASAVTALAGGRRPAKSGGFRGMGLRPVYGAQEPAFLTRRMDR
jgi:hypothetical protein